MLYKGKLGMGLHPSSSLMLIIWGQKNKAFLLKTPTGFTWPGTVRLLGGRKEKQTEDINKSIVSPYACQAYAIYLSGL